MENIDNRAFTTSEEADISCFNWAGTEFVNLREEFLYVDRGNVRGSLHAMGDNLYLVTVYPDGSATIYTDLQEALRSLHYGVTTDRIVDFPLPEMWTDEGYCLMYGPGDKLTPENGKWVMRYFEEDRIDTYDTLQEAFAAHS
jgi:hypothetical protein